MPGDSNHKKNKNEELFVRGQVSFRSTHSYSFVVSSWYIFCYVALNRFLYCCVCCSIVWIESDEELPMIRNWNSKVLWIVSSHKIVFAIEVSLARKPYPYLYFRYFKLVQRVEYFWESFRHNSPRLVIKDCQRRNIPPREECFHKRLIARARISHTKWPRS